MLSEKLKMLRENKKLNKKQMANELGLSYMTYCRYENGEREPNNETLSSIADYFRVSTDYLIGNTIKFDFFPRELDDDAIMNCPICGYEYVHFVRTCAVDFENEKSMGFAIEFLCECGHTFYLVIETYKGNTYIVNADEHCDIDFDMKVPFLNAPVSAAEFFEKESTKNKKYHALDDHGKKMVDIVLNEEYRRIIEKSQFDERPTIELPIKLMKASAGTGQWLGDDEYTERICVADTLAARKANLVVEIDGDSMLPSYKDGDKVLVRLQHDINIGEIGIFVVNGCAYIKEKGNKELISLNPKFDNIAINEYDRIDCVGKVIGIAEIIN